MIARQRTHHDRKERANEVVEEPRPVLRVADRGWRQHDEALDAMGAHRGDDVRGLGREHVVGGTLV
jgi:hypothetical protein